MRRVGAGLLSVVIGVTLLAGAQELELGDVEEKVLRGPDDDGDLLLSIKVLVTNNSDKEQVISLTIKGLDHDDFEIFSLYLRGKVGPNETRAMTDTQSVGAEMYELVDHWKAEL